MSGERSTHMGSRTRTMAGPHLRAMSPRWVGWCVAAVVMAAPSIIRAQDSRAEAIAAEQAAKAARLAPRTPGGLERLVLWVERELVEAPNGFHPLFSSVYSGGGLTGGLGYRHYLGDRAHLDARGSYSIKSYRLVEVSATSRGVADGRVDVQGRAGWLEATEVPFHGLGLDSSRDPSTFAMTQTYGGATLAVRPRPWAWLGGALNFEQYSIGAGRRTPSTRTVFTNQTAPGLDDEPAFVHATASAALDSRPARGYARRGGLYEARYHHYAGLDGASTFGRLDGEVVQHLPVLRESWVLSVHGLAQTTVDPDARVPFYLLPSLGSGDTLRGYSPWRFRDRHALLLSAEFRWTPNRNAVDMAVFYDAGTVAARRGDLSLDRLKRNIGVGIRFHGLGVTPLRAELARGSEGLRLVFAGNAAF